MTLTFLLEIAGNRGPKDKGAWHNPKTGETLHPDLDHPTPEGPLWDYIPYKNGP